MDKAADQNARKMKAISTGSHLKARGGPIVAVGKDDLCLSIIVTLDRVDPFSTHLGRPSTHSNEDRSWVVTLSNLLMIAQVLPTAAEFFGYLRQRVHQIRTGSHLVFWRSAIDHGSRLPPASARQDFISARTSASSTATPKRHSSPRA